MPGGARTTWLAVAAIGVAVVALIAVGLRSPKKAPPPAASGLRVAVLPTCGSALFTYGRERGLFVGDASIDARFYRSGAASIAALGAGKVDLAIVGDMPVAWTSLERDDFVVLARLARSKFDRWLVTRARIDKPSDLRGKRIAAERGTVAQFALDRFLEEASLTEADVELVDVARRDTKAALARGKVDGIVVRSPYHGPASRRFGAEVHEHPAPVRALTFLLVARKKTLEGAPEKVTALLRQLIAAEDAWRRKNTDPAGAAELSATLASELLVSRALMKADCAEMQVAMDLDPSLLEELDRASTWFSEHGARRGRAPREAKSYVDPSYLKAADTSLHTVHTRGL